MKTKLAILLTFCTVFFATVTGVQAAGETTIRLEQPKSPSATNTFKMTFVALDRLNRPVSVSCYKKGPSDGGFSQFGSSINLSAGGNTNNCAVTDAVMNTNGTYQFKAIATAGSDTVESNLVSVDYNTDRPGAPRDYHKEKNSCSVKITFVTADDAGKTSEVELYRSETLSFHADAGSRVAEQMIGSNTAGVFNHVVPDCNKDYYFAIRAFNGIGNGSDVVGDQNIIVTTTTTTTTTTQAPGALRASSNSVGTPDSDGAGESDSVAGDDEVADSSEEVVEEGGDGGENNTEDGQVLGETTDKNFFEKNSKVLIGLGSLAVFLIAVVLLTRKKSTTR